MKQPDYGVDPKFYLPDELWARVEPLLPPRPPKKTLGRPRLPDRQALTAIFYLLRTGCQWNALPRSLGADSTVHDRFQEWRAAGFFERLWQAGLLEYDQRVGLDWEWQALDGAMTKAPLGGGKNRPQSHRPGQAGRQAQPADRRSGPPTGGRRGWGQPTGPETGGRDLDEHPGGPPAAHRAGGAAHAAGRGL